MKEALAQLFRHAFVFLIGLLFQRAARLFLLPLYWSAFSRATFGLLDLFEVFIQVMLLTFSFGLPTAYIKFSRVDLREGADAEALTATTMGLLLAGLAILGVVLLVFEAPLSWLFFEGRHPYLYTVAGLAIAANIAFLMLQGVLRAGGRAVTFVVITSIQFLLLMGFNIWFIQFRGMGVAGALWATVLGWGLPPVVYALLRVGHLRWRFRWDMARRILGFALPLVPFAILVYAVTISGRLFLQHAPAYGADAVGVLAAASRVALILNLVAVTPFQTAWGYLGLDFARRPDAPAIFGRSFTYLLAFGLWTFLAVSAAAREVVLLFGKTEYAPALPYIDPLMAGYLMVLFFYWANAPLMSVGATRRIMLIALGPFAVAIVGGWLTIPVYGIPAACLTFVTAMFLHAVLTAFFANRIVPLAIEKARVAKIVVAFVAIYGIGQAVLAVAIEWRLAVALVEIAAFPVVLWGTRFLTAGEIAEARALWRRASGTGC